jgi:hypothetical protein
MSRIQLGASMKQSNSIIAPMQQRIAAEPSTPCWSRTMRLAPKHTIAAIFLVFATPVGAGPLEDADAAIKRRDYATAVRLIHPLAEQGNANAQYKLGVVVSPSINNSVWMVSVI